MKNVQRGTTGLIIMTEEYEQALANAADEIDAANAAHKE